MSEPIAGPQRGLRTFSVRDIAGRSSFEPPRIFRRLLTLRGLELWDDRAKYSAEMRERAVRLVFEQQGNHESQGAIVSGAITAACRVVSVRYFVVDGGFSAARSRIETELG